MVASVETKPRLAVLISGRGRNLEAILDAVAQGRIAAHPVVVISHREDAQGLHFAREHGVATEVLPHKAFADRAAFDAALAVLLRRYAPDLIALAGFMRILGEAFVTEFQGRLLNIHPSLLPRHPGLHTHARAIAEGDAEHGATVHFVTPTLDGGPAIIQGALPLRDAQGHLLYAAEPLAQRVLEDVELKIYPQALAWMARGVLQLGKDGRVWFKGRPLSVPLGLKDLEDAFQ